MLKRGERAEVLGSLRNCSSPSVLTFCVCVSVLATLIYIPTECMIVPLSLYPQLLFVGALSIVAIISGARRLS